MSRYLFIGSHVDDNELSAGGWIAKLVPNNIIKAVSMSCVYNDVNLSNEFINSMDILGVFSFHIDVWKTREFSSNENAICNDIRKQIIDFEPDVIVTHDRRDRHPDHRIIAEQVLRVFNGSMITYITPFNGDESPNYFVELTEQQLTNKIAALTCYQSQIHRHYMSEDFIRAQARYNGIKCGKLYAEAFKIERLIQ